MEVLLAFIFFCVIDAKKRKQHLENSCLYHPTRVSDLVLQKFSHDLGPEIVHRYPRRTN